MVLAQQLGQRAFPVHIVTAEFCLKGEYRVRGVLHVNLNNELLKTLSLYDVQAQALDPHNVAGQMNAAEVVIARHLCELVIFAERPSHDDFIVMANAQPVIAYTSRFAVRGTAYLSGSPRLAELLEDVKGYFVPVGDAQIFPLFPLRASVPRQSPFVLLYHEQVRMLHAR